jgi:hypothetical protein
MSFQGEEGEKKKKEEKHVIRAQLLISKDRCCTTIKGATKCF